MKPAEALHATVPHAAVPRATNQDVKRFLILSLETTCDETAAAVLEGPRFPATGVPKALSSVVASQFNLHERFGGVVPEIAAREHVLRILPVVDEALRRAEVELKDLGAIAVAVRPGLVGALIVGLTAAKALALALDVPLVAIDHLEGHLYAAQMAYPETSVYPSIGLVVSGGHTSLFHCRGPIDVEPLGGTIDDAAGEAFDKVASMLGLGHPGGPAVEKAAATGNPRAYSYPRAFLHEDRLDFSFSGLKTAVLYTLKGQDARSRENVELSPGLVADIAASFQAAVCDILVAKALRALRKTGESRLIVGGGVAANRSLTNQLKNMAKNENIQLFIPPPAYCTDNAAMGGIAFAKPAAGETADLEIDVVAGLVRGRGEKTGGKRGEREPGRARISGS